MPDVSPELIDAASHVSPLTLAILFLGLVALAVTGVCALLVWRGRRR